MLFRLSWAVVCSWSGIETAPYCPDSDLFEECLIPILDVLFLQKWRSVLRTVAGQVPLFATVVAAPSFSTILAIEPIISTFANVGV